MLTYSQQHTANRPTFSITLCFGMDRVKQRQEKRKAAFQRLRALYRSNTEFAEALGDGFSDSYVSQLLRGHRGIGDDVADKIEGRLRLDQGWLDQDHSPDENRFIAPSSVAADRVAPADAIGRLQRIAAALDPLVTQAANLDEPRFNEFERALADIIEKALRSNKP